MRNAFVDELILAAERHENIALVVGDLGFGVVEPFARRFPDRFVNAGVAEQNMMGLAAGMASEGLHVFVYSIANFPTFRCAEQIRNDVDYHRLPVTVVAVGGGLAYGSLGYSHHAVQDYALMRLFPNMLIAAPGDPLEVRASVRYLIENPQPSYLRLGKAGERCIHDEVPRIAPGVWVPVVGRPATAQHTLLTTGATLDLATHWVAQAEGWADVAVHSMPLWSMKSKAIQPDHVRPWTTVTTVEDHFIDGGFGSWMLEALRSHTDLRDRLRVKALDPLSICGEVGSQLRLNAIGGLTPDSR